MKFTPNTPRGCSDLETHEREATALADKLQAQADKLFTRCTDGANRVELATAKELALAAVRARKLASELAETREGRQHSRWVLAEYKRMHDGPPRAPRAPLRKVS